MRGPQRAEERGGVGSWVRQTPWVTGGAGNGDGDGNVMRCICKARRGEAR